MNACDTPDACGQLDTYDCTFDPEVCCATHGHNEQCRPLPTLTENDKVTLDAFTMFNSRRQR